MAAEGTWNVAVVIEGPGFAQRICWGTIDLGKPETFAVLGLLGNARTQLEATLNKVLQDFPEQSKTALSVRLGTF